MVSSKNVSKFSSAFISITLAVLLAIMLMPLGGTQSANATTSDHTTTDQEIEFLLASGDYVPGEAIAVIDETATIDATTRQSLDSDLLASAESLITASADDYEQTAGNATISDKAAKTLAYEQSTAPDAAVSVRHLSNTGLSTRELLYQFKDDPRVLSIEPNYVFTYGDQETESSSIGAQATTSAIPATATLDLTDYQWGNSNTNKASWVQGKTPAGFDVGPAQWDASRSTPGIENATGTVAILDTGIDHTHPDLQSVVRDDMKSFVAQGGDHGYCSSGPDPSDTMDRRGHGTHVAGITASQWNDYGTSGVASGVRLVAIKAGTDDGGFFSSTALKGYDYLAEAMENGLDLKAINNSWGSGEISPALTLAVTKLGNLGAITIFASGNDSKNIDSTTYITSNLSSNPYAVVVNSTRTNAFLSDSSNYGAATTNIVSPGYSILSTFPLSLAHYYPEAVDPGGSSAQNILYENFAGPTPQVTTYSEDPFLSTQIPIGAKKNDVYFNAGDTASWGVPISKMSSWTNERNLATKCLYLTLDVPNTEKQNLKYLGFHTSLQSSKDVLAVGYAYVLCKDQNGVETWVEAGNDEYTNEWNYHLFDFEEKCYSQNLTPVYRGSTGNTLTVRIAIGDDSFASTDTFCIDAVGIAGDDALVPYAYSNGTSMAAPAATGAAAILATLETDPSLSASENAKLRAARVEGSVQTTVGNFADICTSGGALDLRIAQSGQYSPVLRNATIIQAQDSIEITLSGYFFGSTEGSVLIGGQSATIKPGSWSESSVTVTCPTSVASGALEISLTSSLGKTGKMTRLLELPSPPYASSTPLFEREYTLPYDQGFSRTAFEVPLVGLGGYLYAVSLGEATGISLWKLDPDTSVWTKCAATPDMVQTCSMTTYDGKIYLTGLNATGIATILYSYDPITDTWTDRETDKIPAFSTLVNCNEQLVVIGGSGIFDLTEFKTISIYDPITDILTQKATLTKPGSELKTAVHDSKILITSKIWKSDKLGVNLVDIDTGEVKDLTSALPPLDTTRDNYYSVASVAQGFVLCGASAVTNTKTATLDDQDVYLLDINSLATGAKFEAYGKRASRSQLFSTSATSHRDMLYTYGISYFEEGGYSLRATSTQTLPQPGDLYTISYHNVDAREHTNPTSYSPTRLPLDLANAQDREGKLFAGWYTNADFSGEPITALATSTTGDIELWAQWKTEAPKPTVVKVLSKAGDILPGAMLACAVIALLAGLVLARTARNRARNK